MIRVLLHLGLGGGVVWWSSDGTDPLVCLAVYGLGLMLLDGPNWAR